MTQLEQLKRLRSALDDAISHIESGKPVEKRDEFFGEGYTPIVVGPFSIIPLFPEASDDLWTFRCKECRTQHTFNSAGRLMALKE